MRRVRGGVEREGVEGSWCRTARKGDNAGRSHVPTFHSIWLQGQTQCKLMGMIVNCQVEETFATEALHAFVHH